jgi:thiamine biosynthesis lipoprotein
MIVRRSFRAMGTDCEWILEVDDPSDAIAAFAAAERDLERREAEWSRFRSDSALSRLNREGVVLGSPEMADLVAQALELRTQTQGLFDPTMHDAVVEAGYDRTFDEINDVAGEQDASRGARRGGGEVSVCADTGTIRLAEGVRIDLGGIAKGYAADRAADSLAESGPCVVNLGGEVVARGAPWPVGIETRDAPQTVEVSHGAVATSGVDRRRWTAGSAIRHHVMDPRTGKSAATDLLRVTVIDADGARADALATALLVAGRDRALRMMEQLGVAGILQTTTEFLHSRAGVVA